MALSRSRRRNDAAGQIQKKKKEALEMIEVLSKLPEDARGRKKLEIPVGHSVLDNARKALKYVADCQQ
ncbi:hypothetical protein BGZ75_002422, partial [Mortierella antarctica]